MNVPQQSRGIQSIEVGFELLESLSRSSGPMTLTALAASVAMSPSKAHFYVTSFVRLGLVARAEEGAYTLGPAAIRIGIAALSQVDVLRMAREALLEVRDQTGFAAHLSVWGNHGPTIVERMPSLDWSPVEIRVGFVLDYLSASGRAFLSCYTNSAVEGLLRHAIASATPTMPWYRMSLAKARALLDDVRRDGYAIGFNTVIPGSGFRGIAAPIVDNRGNCLAVIVINGNAASLDISPNGKNARVLLSVTRRISHNAGDTRADAILDLQAPASKRLPAGRLPRYGPQSPQKHRPVTGFSA